LALLPVLIGGVFALLLVLNALLQTVRRSPLGFVHTALAFLALLVVLAGLIENQTAVEPGTAPNNAAILIAAALVTTGLVTALLELRRPERLKGSRGVFSIGVGALMALSAFGVPFAAAYTQLAASQTAATVTPVVAAANASAPTPGATPTGDVEQARQVFVRVLDVIAAQTGLDRDTITQQLDSGTTVAQLVKSHNGDLESVIKGITSAMRPEIEALSKNGGMPAVQAALVLSQLENIVRIGVNRDLAGSRLGDFLRGGNPEATGEAIESTSEAAQMEAATSTRIPTFTATERSTPTLTPSVVPTATPTRFHFQTRTPTPTPTEVTPCVALTRYNVNLRGEPSLDAEMLATIPFNTTVALYGRTEDSGWWLAQYQGKRGWLKADYLTLTADCAALPAAG
jgi:hypothetical protein